MYIFFLYIHMFESLVLLLIIRCDIHIKKKKKKKKRVTKSRWIKHGSRHTDNICLTKKKLIVIFGRFFFTSLIRTMFDRAYTKDLQMKRIKNTKS